MKKILCIALALLMLLSLTACGAQAPAPAATEAPAQEAPAAPEAAPEAPAAPDYSGKSLQIHYPDDATWKDVTENYVMPAIAEKFPGLEVEYILANSVSYSSLAAVGELPDIWFATVNAPLVEASAILDLKPYIADWMAENFNNPTFHDDSKGRIWAVGAGEDTFYTPVFYYNVDVFNELGLKAPETFDDLLNACQTLLDAGYATPLSHSGWTIETYWLEQCIVSYDPEAYMDLMANKTDFNDPRIRAAIANAQKLIDSGALGKGTVEKDAGVSIAEFVQGDAPIMTTFSWNSASIAGQTAFEVGQFFLPSANEKYPTGTITDCWGGALNGWSVNAATEDPDLTTAVLMTIVEASAQRMFDNGLITNFKVEGDITFPNELDTQRYEMYQNVKTFCNAFYVNALDTSAFSEYRLVLTDWLMDGSTMDADGLCDAMQAVWENNQYFEIF